MSGKTKLKPENKLVVESVRPFNVLLNSSTFERNSLGKPKPRCQILNFTHLPSSHSPPPSSMLEALIAKHTLKTRHSEKFNLNSRPKTVLGKKKKLKGENIAENSKEATSFLENLPKFVHNSKKENSKISNYEFGDEIGRGAFGTVRLGIHTETGEKVAIKIYEKSSLITPNRKKNIQREIKILNKLFHPNIVRLLTTVETSSSYNLVLEYISGCSLKDYLASRSSKRIDESQAISIMSQLLNCLDFMHGKGVCHRDLKLENILIDESHTVKLIDFGFSTYISTNKKVQLYCGTFYYMAPEVLLNKESFGPPIDIWACGVLLYVLITGTFPFKGKTKQEVYSKMLNKTILLPSHLSSDVKDLISSIFDVDPENRPTAGQVLSGPWINNWKMKSMINKPFTY
jgi:MAP/microtubule affinity-regulating kinase